jgi:hypothetical protein
MHDGIQPIPKKVEVRQNKAPPKTRKELCQFIGHLTSTAVPWQRTDIEQKTFDMMKQIISWETLLVYPNFTQPFILHTDTSH